MSVVDLDLDTSSQSLSCGIGVADLDLDISSRMCCTCCRCSNVPLLVGPECCCCVVLLCPFNCRSAPVIHQIRRSSVIISTLSHRLSTKFVARFIITLSHQSSAKFVARLLLSSYYICCHTSRSLNLSP